MSKEPGSAPGTPPDWRGLADHVKYDQFAGESPEGWWDLKGPLAGLHVLNRARIVYFREKMGGFDGKRILDVGCGGGILSESLASEGAKVVAVDPSPASIEVAREHARRGGLSIDFRVGFAEKIDLREEFDIVFAVDVLEHVENLGASIAACAGALKPGGFFGFLTHNQTLEAFTFMIWEQEYQRKVMPKGAHDFHKFITPQAMRALLEQFGMEGVEVRGLTRSGSGESYSIQVSDDTSISYLGYARKRRGNA
jgi:2-polyprenyl-6-hydroxyphenyl methylase/3-demethylubiquinone-9 3-methyltransferase